MNLTPEEKYLLIKTLLSIEKIGERKILSVGTKLGELSNLFNASASEISEANGISFETAKRIRKAVSGFPASSEKFRKELETLKDKGIKFLTVFDEAYPKPLRNIFLPPLIIYYYGEIKKEDSNSVAIVGTRKPTNYGKSIATKISAELTKAGLTIVSGMARGIDSIAHRACLENGGRTIAVIGSGLDVIYPPENKDLFKAISENGAVITEYPLGTKPDAKNFPRRNRIISGLTLGTAIVETTLNGGAMHTAAYALDQGREIFAVPGNVNFPTSEGCNTLIKKGEAKLIQNTKDILDELPVEIKGNKRETKQKTVEMNIFESKIFDVLAKGTLHIDKIAELTGLGTPDCLVHLLSLEFKGVVKQLPGKMFVRI